MAGPGLTVTGDYGVPYFVGNTQSAGMTRYNPTTQNMEVYDGTVWITMCSNPSIGLDNETLDIINWARTKMYEEQQLKALLEKHPGLKDLHEKFELMKALCQSDKENAAR